MDNLDFENAPKVGTKQWKVYKSQVCEQALKIKKKIDTLASQYGEVQAVLIKIFEADDTEYFSESGAIKLTSSNSYSVDESNIEKLSVVLNKKGLVIDDYINQSTAWKVTAKLRGLIEKDPDIANLVTVKSNKSIQIKASK